MTRCLHFRPGPSAFGHAICSFNASFYDWSVSVAAALFNEEPDRLSLRSYARQTNEPSSAR